MYYPSNEGYIGIASQEYQKTTVAAVTKFVAYTADETGPDIAEEVLREGGDGQYDVTSVKTLHKENVNFSLYARPEISANLYAALLGDDTPSHLTTTPFYHTIIPKSNQATTAVQKWLTVEKMLIGTTVSKVQRLQSCKISSITLTGEAGKPVSMQVEGSGLTGSLVTTAATPSYETGNPFSFYNGIYHVNAPTTSNFDIKSFSIKITAVNDEEIQTVALTRQDIINHRFNVEVTLGLDYTSYVMFAKANYGAGTSPTATYSDGSFTVSLKTNAGTTSEERLQIAVPKVRLKPHIIGLNPEPNTLEQPLSGMGFKQATTELVTVTCYNQIATTLPL